MKNYIALLLLIFGVIICPVLISYKLVGSDIIFWSIGSTALGTFLFD